MYANPNTLISISLCGTLNVFDTRQSSSTKWRTLIGPSKAITSSILADNHKTFYTGSFDGAVKAFEVHGNDEGLCHEVEGTGHNALVAGMATDGEGMVWSAAWDDKIACIEAQKFG